MKLVACSFVLDQRMMHTIKCTSRPRLQRIAAQLRLQGYTLRSGTTRIDWRFGLIVQGFHEDLLYQRVSVEAHKRLLRCIGLPEARPYVKVSDVGMRTVVLLPDVCLTPRRLAILKQMR